MFKRVILMFLFLCSARALFAQQAPMASPNPSPTIPAAQATPPIRDLVNQLDQPPPERVIEQVQSSYVDSSALTDDEINQPADEGLLAPLGPGARLKTKTQPA